MHCHLPPPPPPQPLVVLPCCASFPVPSPEPVFVFLLGSPGIFSQLAESIPGLLKHLQMRAQFLWQFFPSSCSSSCPIFCSRSFSSFCSGSFFVPIRLLPSSFSRSYSGSFLSSFPSSYSSSFSSSCHSFFPSSHLVPFTVAFKVLSQFRMFS